MRRYVFEMTYEDGYTEDIIVQEETLSNIERVWVYAMGQATNAIQNDPHGMLVSLTLMSDEKVLDVSRGNSTRI